MSRKDFLEINYKRTISGHHGSIIMIKNSTSQYSELTWYKSGIFFGQTLCLNNGKGSL